MFSEPEAVGLGYGDMLQHFLEKRDRITWLDLVSSRMPPRNPNNNGDEEDEDDDENDEEHEEREPAVIREPDPD